MRGSGSSNSFRHPKTGPGSWTPRLRSRGEEGLLGGWHEQRQREVGAEHPSAGTHRPLPQHPSPSEAPGSRLPRRWPAILLSTQKSCVRCHVAGPCPGEDGDSDRGRMPGQRGTSGGCGEGAQGGPGSGGQGLSRVDSSVLYTESTGAPGVPGPGTQQRGRDGAQRARRPSPDQTCGSRRQLHPEATERPPVPNHL